MLGRCSNEEGLGLEVYGGEVHVFCGVPHLLRS